MTDLSFLEAENRIADCKEFFGWNDAIVKCLIAESLQYYEGPWNSLLHNPDLYYSCGFYTVRQLSYTRFNGHLSIEPNQETRRNLDEIISDKGATVMEIGAGVFDNGLFLSRHGVKYYGVEHSGIPVEFAAWRVNKYNSDIEVLDENDKKPEVDYILAYSCLDHIYNPIETTKALLKLCRKKMFARPLIDEHYAETRPAAHDPVILKDLPECFKLIAEHNKSNDHF